MRKSLDAWTKIGDNVADVGSWRVYKRSLRTVFRELKHEGFPDAEKATRAYQKASETLRQGGVYLVNPEGVVAACIWIPPTLRYH
jgi:hypothetical protein